MAKTLPDFARQLLELGKKLTPVQRVSLALVVLATVAGITWTVSQSARTDYALLYGRLDDAEAGRVVAALNETKVPYRTGKTPGALYVPADKVHLVRMQLAAKGIPKGDGVGFEIFDKPNFGISDFVQRANYVRALQGELARTISQLDEVDAARVMVVLPENRLLIGENKQPTASVFIRVKGNGTLPAEAVHSIRFLVANAVEGLVPNRVTVVDNRGNVLAQNNSDETSLPGLTAGQLGARQKLEQYLAQKAQSMLEQVLGPGQAVVRVAVELNTETVNRTEEKFDPKGQVARSTTLTEEDNNSTTANNTQSPGMATNASVETNSNSAANSSTSTSTRTHRKTENNQFEVSRVTSNVIQNPGDLKRVSAAVFVAARPATGNATGRKPAARSPEELQKLKRIVQSALGLQLSDTAGRADEITLEEMPFTDWFAADAPAPESAPATKPVTPMPRWVLYSIVAGGAVALAGAFLWFRRRAAVPRLDVTIPAMAPAPVPVTEGNGHEEPDTITVEYLSRLMREQPHNVTQAVRGWLAEPDESKEDDES